MPALTDILRRRNWIVALTLAAAAAPLTGAQAQSGIASKIAHRPLKKGDHIFLVDGSSYIFRAYFAMKYPTKVMRWTGSSQASAKRTDC